MNSVRFRELCTDLLRDGRSVRFTATGGSMAPAIRDGDILTVEPVALAQIRTGDVVLYETDRGLTAHRVVGIEGAPIHLRCRGDAVSEDDLVPAGQVHGRVDGIERVGLTRRLLRRMTRRLGLNGGAFRRHLMAKIRASDPNVTVSDAPGRGDGAPHAGPSDPST